MLDKKTYSDVLFSKGFLCGLALLLANDFYFKYQYHNWITGKLSDFAGLFIFPLFWSIYFSRYKRLIYLITAVGFLFWKSVYSEPIISLLNSTNLFSVNRIIDLSDCVALLILPLSYYFPDFQKRPPIQNRFSCKPIIKKAATILVICITTFAFVATQLKDEQTCSYDKEYEINLTKDVLIDKLNKIGLDSLSYHRMPDYLTENTPIKWTEEDKNIYYLTPKTKYCKSSLSASVTFHTFGNKTKMKLNYVHYFCDVRGKDDGVRILHIFEQEVIDKLLH